VLTVLGLPGWADFVDVHPPDQRSGCKAYSVAGEQCGVRREMPAFSEHPCHAAFKGNVHRLFERPIANLPPEPRPVPADRYTPLSTFRLGKGKEAQRAVYDSNNSGQARSAVRRRAASALWPYWRGSKLVVFEHASRRMAVTKRPTPAEGQPPVPDYGRRLRRGCNRQPNLNSRFAEGALHP
jgi:hypothetical protein